MKLSSRSYIPLVTVPGPHEFNVMAVPIHHQDLDSLIGQLMQMFELNGDVEQRNAQKSAAKQICRDWLDNSYLDKCGYDKHTGEVEGGKTLKLDKYEIEMSDGS